MAPNRKSLSALVQSLSSTDLVGLQATVQPKYLPLTHPLEASQQAPVAPQTPQQQQQTTDSASYWEWSADAEDQQAAEAATVCILSTENIISNLIQANTASSEETPVSAESDAYWAEAADQQEAVSMATVSTKPQHTIESSYWEWPADADAPKAILERLLQEEAAYRLTSGAASQATEQAAAAVRRSATATRRVSSDTYWAEEQPQHLQSDYWAWETPTEANQKQQTLDAIMEYERVRQLLMATMIVQQLQGFQAADASTPSASNDDYWCDVEQDQYWDAPAFTAKAVAVTGSQPSYWDW